MRSSQVMLDLCTVQCYVMNARHIRALDRSYNAIWTSKAMMSSPGFELLLKASSIDRQKLVEMGSYWIS